MRWHYKYWAPRVGLVQSRHHLVKMYKLLSAWNSWKIAHLASRQHPLAHSKWKWKPQNPAVISILAWNGTRGGRDRMVVRFITTYAICLSPLKLWVRIPLRRGVLDTTWCDQVCQWLATGRWFSPCTPVSWPPRYNWNIVESGIKYHNLHRNGTNTWWGLLIRSRFKVGNAF